MKQDERDKEATAFFQAYRVLFVLIVAVLSLWFIFNAIIFYLLGWLEMSYTYRFILGSVIATFIVSVLIWHIWKK